jgi:hypothetical protein
MKWWRNRMEMRSERVILFKLWRGEWDVIVREYEGKYGVRGVRGYRENKERMRGREGVSKG